MSNIRELFMVLLTGLLISLCLFDKCIGDEPKVIIKPTVAGTWRLDDNFYKSEAEERGVHTWLAQPGIDLGFETNRSRTEFHYTLDMHYYDDNGTVPVDQTPADDDNFIGHTGTLTVSYGPSDRVLISFDGGVNVTRDPAQSDMFNNSVDRDEYAVYRLTPMLFYEIVDRLKIGLRYRNTEINYDPALREDSSEHRGMFDLIYNFSELFSADLEYQLWEKNYGRDSSDYRSHQFKLVLRRQMKYFSLVGGAGYQFRSFDDPLLEDTGTFTFRAGFEGQNPPAPDKDPRSYISVFAERNLNDQGTGNNYYQATRVTWNAGHVFLEKLRLETGGYYQNSDYETFIGLTPADTEAKRDDNTYDLWGGVGYDITDWLNLAAKGGREWRESNLAGYDYDNNYVLVTLTFGYKLGRK